MCGLFGDSVLTMTTTLIKPFEATSNLTRDGRTVYHGMLPDQDRFKTLKEAESWLREKRCGGQITEWHGDDWHVVKILEPGDGPQMNNPKTPFHAASNYDAFGQIPFESRLPKEEEDFGTRKEARAWLAQRGGGVIERHCNHCRSWQRVEVVAPAASETALLI